MKQQYRRLIEQAQSRNKQRIAESEEFIRSIYEREEIVISFAKDQHEPQ